MSPPRRARPGDWFHAYTRDLSSDDFRRLFTHDTRDAYDFFTRGHARTPSAALPWWKRLPLRFRQFMVAFTMRLPPARRALYISALVIAAARAAQAVSRHRRRRRPVRDAVFPARPSCCRMWATRHLHAAARRSCSSTCWSSSKSPIACRSRASSRSRARSSWRCCRAARTPSHDIEIFGCHPPGQHRRRRLLRRPAAAVTAR